MVRADEGSLTPSVDALAVALFVFCRNVTFTLNANTESSFPQEWGVPPRLLLDRPPPAEHTRPGTALSTCCRACPPSHLCQSPSVSLPPILSLCLFIPKNADDLLPVGVSSGTPSPCRHFPDDTLHSASLLSVCTSVCLSSRGFLEGRIAGGQKHSVNLWVL